MARELAAVVMGDGVRDVELGGHVPSGLIDNHHGVGAWIDGLADLGQMRRHRRDVTPRHDQASALALGGTDSAEDVG